MNGASGQKRHHSDEEELASLRQRVVAKMAALMERPDEEVEEAAKAAPSATLLELGLTSAMGIAIKGWAFHELSAELTTFECLKQPLAQVIESIEAARRHDLGASIPEMLQQPSLPASATHAATS